MKGQSHCCFIITDVSVVIILAKMIIMMSVKALMFKRGRGQSKLPGPVLILGTSGLGASCSVPINLGGCAAFLQGLVLVFCGSEIKVSLSRIKIWIGQIDECCHEYQNIKLRLHKSSCLEVGKFLLRKLELG